MQVHLDCEPFTVERDLVTPTFKMRRPQLLKHYKAAVDEMYAQVNAAARAAEKAKGTC